MDAHSIRWERHERLRRRIALGEGLLAGLVVVAVVLVGERLQGLSHGPISVELPFALGLLLGWRHGRRAWLCIASSSAALALGIAAATAGGLVFDRADDELTAAVIAVGLTICIGSGLGLAVCGRGLVALLRSLGWLGRHTHEPLATSRLGKRITEMVETDLGRT